MSSELIDEKVVSLKFDNKKFEDNASQSLSTIQKLKQALNFNDAQKSLEGLTKASNQFQLSGIGRTVDEIKDKFSVMEVAARAAITNITNKLVNAAESWAKAVTIDPISTGFGIYEQKINSVQTILNNSGKSLRETNKILNELNEYSDKTIFSLNDMTTALGKFTSQGVDAAEAVEIIKGAANEAASMGAGSAEFSRMIYNLTQAYGMGSMKILDWKSFENANVAGKEFKEQVIKAAIAVGTLDKEGRTLDKHIKVTTSNFREYLNTGFMSAEVMTKVFQDYASESTEVGKKANAAAKNVKTFHQLMDVLAESVASTWSQSFQYIIGDFYEARRLWTNISTIFEETVGKMNKSRNALLAGWKEGFIDPAVEAKMSADELRSALNSKEFVESNTLSGRTMLFDAIANAFQAILQVIKPVKEAFRDIFPAATSKNLWDMTRNLRDFTASLKLNDWVIKDIHDAFMGFFMILRTGRTIIKDIIGAIIPATKNVESLAVVIVRLAGYFGRLVTEFLSTIRTSEKYQNVMTNIGKAATILIRIIITLISKIAQFISAAYETGLLQKVFNVLVATVRVFVALMAKVAPIVSVVLKIAMLALGTLMLIIGKVVEVLEGLFGKFFGGKSEGEAIGENVVAGIGVGLLSSIGDLILAIGSVAGALIDTFKKVLGIASPSKVFIALGAFVIAGLLLGMKNGIIDITKVTDSIKNVLMRIGEGFKYIKEEILGFRKEGSVITSYMTTFGEKVGDVSVGLLDRIGSALASFGAVLKSINWGVVLIAGIIGTLLFGVIRLISTFYNAAKAIRNATKTAENFSRGFNNFAKAFKRAHSPLIETLKGIALCVMGVAASLWLLSTLKDSGKLDTAIIALLTSFGLILITATAVAKYADKNELTDEIKNLALMMLSMAGSLMILSLAFSTVAAVINSSNGDWTPLLQSLAVMAAMAAILVGVALAISKFAKTDSVKTMASILIWSLSLTKVMKALENLVKSAKGLKNKNIKALWLAGILPIGALMLGVAAMGVAFRKVGVGSTTFVLVMIWGVKKIIDSIAQIDFDKVPWREMMDRAQGMQNFLIMLLLGFVTAVTVMAVAGEGLKDFAKGLLLLVVDIGIMALVCKAIDKLNISDRALDQAMRILRGIGLLTVVLIVTMHFFDIPSGSFIGFTLIILSLCAVIKVIAKATADIAGLSFGGGPDIFRKIAKAIDWMIIVLAVLAIAMKFANGAPIKEFALVVFGIAAVVLSLVALTKVYEGVKTGVIVAAISSLVVIFAGIFFIIAAISHVHDASSFKPLIAIVAGLAVLITGLMLLSNFTEPAKLGMAMVAIGGLMALLALIIYNVSKVKKVNTGPIVAAVVGIAVIAGSLLLLAKLTTFEELIGPLVAMSAVMLVLAVVMYAMSKVKSSALAPMILGVVTIVAVAGSLALLSYFDWDSLMDAAQAMSMVLIAVAGVLWLLSNLGGSSGKVVVSAASILIVSGAMLVLAFAMNTFNDLNWELTKNAIIILGSMALSLALLGIVGPMVVVGAAAILIAAASMIPLAYALNMMVDINWDVVKNAIIMIGALSLCLALLGAVGPLTIVGAAALLVAAIALGVVAVSLGLLSTVPIDSKVLIDLAKGLAVLGASGLALLVGAAGLITGGIGLTIIAGALILFNKLDSSVNGDRLSGLAGGLAVMAAAGLALILGATGLILGAIGVGIMGASLQEFNNVQLTGNELKDIGVALLTIGAAGILGIVAGPGLILLSAGITALAGAIWVVMQVITSFLGLSITKMGEDAVSCGEYVVGGLQEGIVGGLHSLWETVTGLANNVIGWFCKIMGIHSNSDKFIDIGKFILGGLGEGVTDSLMNGNLSDAMKAVADNLLGSFTGELGGGFGKIGDILNKFTGKTKKSVYKKLSDHGGAGGGEIWGWVVEEVEENMFSGFGFDTLGDQLTGLFNTDSIFNGVNGLTDSVQGLDLSTQDLDYSTGGLTNDMNGLADGLGKVSDASGKTTKSFADNIDIFSEFDRSLKTTVNNIQENMLNNLLGTSQWETYLENLKNWGYDPQLVKFIKDKGMSQGFELAAALDSVGSNIAKVNEINDLFNAEYGTGGLAELAEKREKELEAWCNAETEGSRDVSKIKRNVGQNAGEMAEIANGYADQNVLNEIYSNPELEFDKQSQSFYDSLQRLQKENEANKDKTEKESSKETEEIANSAMADLSTAIKNAIKLYLPASEFIDIGQNVCIGFGMGVYNAMTWPLEKVQQFCESVIKVAKGELKVSSPSKVFKQIGEYCNEGLAIGLGESVDAEKSTLDLGKTLIEEMKEQLANIQKLIESDEEWRPVIRPVVDLTDLQAMAEQARAMFDSSQVNMASRDFSNYKSATQPNNNSIVSMSKDEFARFLSQFAEDVADGINSDEREVNVNVTLEGDAKGLFRVVKAENKTVKRTTGYSALI